MNYSQTTTILLLIVTLLFSESLSAKVTIHTDNKYDVDSMLALTPLGISAETNLHVLNMPNPNIKLRIVPYNRSVKYMEGNASICVLNRIKTKERANKYIFSKPINLFLNRRLFQSPKHPPLKDTPVDLIALFKKYPNRVLIVSHQLSYGDKLDAIIKELPKNNILVSNTANQSSTLINMFYKGRADYGLFSTHEMIGEYVKLNAHSYEVEGLAPYLTGHLMCTDTPETKALIRSVNLKVKTLVNSGALYEMHKKHLSPAQHLYLKPYYQQVFGQINNNPVTSP